MGDWEGEVDHVNKVKKRNMVWVKNLSPTIPKKIKFEAEPYVKANLPRAQCKALTQFRALVAPLAQETGCYQGLLVQERLFSLEVP